MQLYSRIFNKSNKVKGINKRTSLTNLQNNRSIITFATNNLDYVKFALKCAQSILVHNDLPIFIVSNLNFVIPSKLQNNVFLVPASPEHASLGIAIKLYIDKYIQTEQTLFIDSDCMCFGSLDGIFTACQEMNIAAVGNIVPSENWVTNEQAKTIQHHFGIDKLIRFNGGLYYVKNNDITKSIFDRARTIADKYDEYGFDRIKNKWMNEEVPLSIAMTLFKQHHLADNGTHMTDLYTDNRPGVINVLTGKRLLKNPAPPAIQNRPWYPSSYSPSVLHFGGNNFNSYPYVSQSILLKLDTIGLPVWLSSSFVSIFVHLPFRFYYRLSVKKKIDKTGN